MSHRIKRFAAFAIFYRFAAVDSILGLGGHQGGHRNRHRNDKIKSTRRDGLGVHVSRSLNKSFVPLFNSSMQRVPGLIIAILQTPLRSHDLTDFGMLTCSATSLSLFVRVCTVWSMKRAPCSGPGPRAALLEQSAGDLVAGQHMLSAGPVIHPTI
jgi:hypothetical protein